MNRKFIMSIAAIGLLSSCMNGPSAKQGVVQGAEQKGGFMGLSKNEAVMVTTPKAFTGIDQVVIGGFTVGFATYKTDSVKAGGGLMGSGFGGKSTAKSTLTGVDSATMQKITDALYADFVKNLQSGGYNVVDRSKLLAHSEFAKTNVTKAPYEDSTGGLFGKGSVTKFHVPSGFNGLRSFMDVPGLTGGFGFSNPALGAADYATKTGVKVLSVVYVLDFANAESYGGWHTMSSSVQVGQGLTIVPNTSKISLIGGQSGTFSNNSGAIAVGQPITSMKEYASVADSTTGTAKGVEIATNVIGALGGIGTNSTRTYTFVARAGDYSNAAIDAGKNATNVLVAKMKALK